MIHPVACAVPNKGNDSPQLSGRIPEIRIRPGSYLHSFYKADTVSEEFFCNYEVNPEFEWTIAEAGFPVVARDENGAARAIESPAHRFFVATLFQPQLSSKPGKPHPVIVEFVRAAAKWKSEKSEDSVLE